MVVCSGLMSWFVVVHSGLMSWFVVIHTCLPVCLPVWVSVMMSYAWHTWHAWHTQIFNLDDLDLDEFWADAQILHKLCKFGGEMIKKDIVLHPYLLITERGAFKMYIFHFKSCIFWKYDLFSVTRWLVREWQFPHFFRSQQPGKLPVIWALVRERQFWPIFEAGNQVKISKQCIPAADYPRRQILHPAKDAILSWFIVVQMSWFMSWFTVMVCSGLWWFIVVCGGL